MIDIHNHLIYGVDDGSKSLEESIDILKNMKKCGYTDIIFTPHYIKDTRYSSSKDNNLKILNNIKQELINNKIDLNLYLGNEIYIDDDIEDLLNDNLASSLNNSKYLLIELPMSGEYAGYQELFKDLIRKGYKVILAHPERYLTVQEDFSLVYELKNIGVYLQSNIDSLIGKYGEDAKRVIERLLKENLISFLATDIHHPKHDYNAWEIAKKIALKYITENEFENLTKVNPNNIIC